jgi:DNA-binding MarR family transcriptional regulator
MHDAPVALPELDRAIHEPARLGIVALLHAVEAADFTFLRQRMGLTAGNLSTHLAKLEEAGYLRAEKSFNERRPLTTLRLTPAGRTAFAAYADAMRRFLDHSVGPAAPAARSAPSGAFPAGQEEPA